VRSRLPVSLLPTSGDAASLPQVRDDETALTAAIERLASEGQACVADLATGRAESAEEATETRPYVVNEGSCVRRAWATRAYLARAAVHDLVIDAFVFEEALGRSGIGSAGLA
jgi:hypothetical protein